MQRPSIDPIRNIAVWIDNTFSMKPHVINTCKSACSHLHNIRRIRKYLSRDSTEKLIHAFVSSRLDYCSGLLYGLPKKLISKLQRVQNTAARIVYCMPTFCHITPLLFDLHWLPVKRWNSELTIRLLLLHLSVFTTQHHTTYQVYYLSKWTQSMVSDQTITFYFPDPTLKRWLQLVIGRSLLPHLNCGIHYHWL